MWLSLTSLDLEKATKVDDNLLVLSISSDQKQDSNKIEVRENHKFGKGLFATAFISKDEFICGFYGTIYISERGAALPESVANHLIQFDRDKFRDSAIDSIARYSNHSCEPNCGINGLFDLVAMKEIQPGEELVWDYAMTENLDWQVPGGKCLCESKTCRRVILPHRELPDAIKEKYKNYTSEWIKKEGRN